MKCGNCLAALTSKGLNRQSISLMCIIIIVFTGAGNIPWESLRVALAVPREGIERRRNQEEKEDGKYCLPFLAIFILYHLRVL